MANSCFLQLLSFHIVACSCICSFLGLRLRPYQTHTHVKTSMLLIQIKSEHAQEVDKYPQGQSELEHP